MMGFSDFLMNNFIDALLRGFTYPATPGSIYIALLNVNAISSDTGSTIMFGGGGTGQEPGAVDYVRVPYGPSPTDWINTQNSGSGPSTGTGGQTMNVNAITWPTAGISWGTINGVAICDQLTGGNLLFFGPLAGPIAVGIGVTFSFDLHTLEVIMQCP